MIAEIVHQSNVDAVWPFISKSICDCIDRFGNDASAGDLWTMCRAGHVYLIIARTDTEIKGASIWRYETWVGETVLRNLMVVGDDMETWIDTMFSCARDLALCGNASAFVCEGRPGWQRIFKNAKPYKISYRMEV